MRPNQEPTFTSEDASVSSEREQDSPVVFKEESCDSFVNKENSSENTLDLKENSEQTTFENLSENSNGDKMTLKKEEGCKSDSEKRSETPPLKRLMRQDPLPLFMSEKGPSPPKKIYRDELYYKKTSRPVLCNTFHGQTCTHPSKTSHSEIQTLFQQISKIFQSICSMFIPEKSFRGSAIGLVYKRIQQIQSVCGHKEIGREVHQRIPLQQF